MKLSDFIRPNAKVSQLCHDLLKSVYIVDDAPQGLDFSSRYPTATFVTKEGEFFSGSVALVGSQSDSDESLLFGRETRLRELRAKLVELGLEKERLAERRHNCAEKISVYQDRLKEYAELLPKLQVRLADAQSRQEHSQRQSGKLEERLNELRTQEEQVVSEVNALNASEHDLQVAVSVLVSERNENSTMLESFEKEYAEKAQSKERLLVELARLESQWETIHDRFQQTEQHWRRLEQSIQIEKESQKAKAHEKEGLVARLAETEEQLYTLKTQADEITSEREALFEGHNTMTQKRQGAVDAVQSIEGELSNSQKELSDFQSKSHELEMESQRSEHEWTRTRDRIVTQYQVDLNDPVVAAEALEITDETLPDTEEMEHIREKLAKYGPVNLIAVEEYGDLKERHDFLDREQEDLLRAKDDIHKALLKINRTTRELFVETFTQIQTYFSEYYKILFRGGHAEIILLDEGDVLESGIEIVARPPGKKLQSITLLSGGEKALTAIALMFAVFKAKPSPFCVLDEIDAPLDDTNVQRFVDVLQEFIKESQFIIITHNKRTMSVADVLYGVTMERSGISKVVSVKFTEEETIKQVQSNRRLFDSEPAKAAA